MSSVTEPKRALRIKVYRNGDKGYMGKCFVLNRRRIRTWDSFLQAVTLDVKSTEAVRSIRTPNNGSRIKSLDDLAQDEKYVAVGNGGFKKLEYINLEQHQVSQKNLTPRNVEVKPVLHSRLQVPGRIASMETEVICIFVYANGLELQPAHRVKLKIGLRNHFSNVLQEISEKIEHLTGPVMKLHRLDGEQVTNAEGMKTGDEYVAVGRDIRFFRRLNYGATRPAFNNSPKRLSSRGHLPPMPRRRTYRSRVSSNQTNTTASQSHATGLDSVTSPGSSVKSHNRSSVARNERAPRPPYRASPRKEEDTVFHAKPIKHRRSDKKPDQVDYDKDDGGVFRAKSQQEEAMEVEETKDTKVDRPIDQVEAEEVKDEEIEDEHPKKSQRKQSQPQKSAEGSHQKRTGKKEQKKETPEATDRDVEGEKAAVKIQSNYRGYKTRKDVKQLRAEAEKEKNEAAVKIQARYRGYKTRKEVQTDAKKPEDVLTKQG